MATVEFVNESGLDFTDISSEKYREYLFPNGISIRIEGPQFLNVSKSGGHRILDINQRSHYIPSGWIHLQWEVFEGEPNFVL
jgi:hypothetical protein